MFTGIVEGFGTVREVRRGGRGARLTIDAASAFGGEAVRDGDSVAVNGVCLTVVRYEDGLFSADLSSETLVRTTLGRLAPGAAVNVERPVPANGRLGGHIVQGHVDGVGRVVALREEGETRRLEITASAELAPYIVERGSITVDGVSLTVTGAAAEPRGAATLRFGVALIPHTCGITTLGGLEPGHDVNVEVDILAKYVERLTQPLRPGRGRRTGAPRARGTARRPRGRRRKVRR